MSSETDNVHGETNEANSTSMIAEESSSASEDAPVLAEHLPDRPGMGCCDEVSGTSADGADPPVDTSTPSEDSERKDAEELSFIVNEPAKMAPAALSCSVCLDPLGEGVTLAWDGGDDRMFSKFEVKVAILVSREEADTTGAAVSKMRLPCGHSFHCGCAMTWLHTHGTCPNCRSKVTPHSQIPDEQQPRPSQGEAMQSPQESGFFRRLWNRTLPDLGTGGRARWMTENIRILRRGDRTIHLDFSSCRTANDSFVKAFIEKAGDKLVGLECPGLPITKKTVKYVYRNCPNIETLDVSHCLLSRKVMAKLVTRCPFLKHLILAYCQNVTDDVLNLFAGAPFASGPGLRRLVTLDLAHNQRISDKGLNALQTCSNLQTLRIPYCTRITDGCLTTLLPRLVSLTTLSLRGCPLVTNRTVRTIANSNHALERIDIVGCVRVDSARSTGVLVRNLPNLSEFLSRDVILTSDNGNGVEGLRNRMVEV
eukprot:CAMPEP_0118933424 /NCGR_PEP_ID=MMETSP1169-20130426/11979_1 /TAXON_ID=36882 /ORGANISM="Pyramimonas obovata, Strain CCMP722" /LENGTH=480 /DNA_ID=CAMNT_0006876181 /DNA_START=26 /DNA_END=1468 /DNA_ORIENTATION=+